MIKNAKKDSYREARKKKETARRVQKKQKQERKYSEL